jgi:hypothetical protein
MKRKVLLIIFALLLALPILPKNKKYTASIPFVIIDRKLQETSGLAYYQETLWTFNDSGGDPAIYRLHPETGNIIQTVRLVNAKNVDWEDIAQDQAHFYIGDFGNNLGNRKDQVIYKIKKKDIPPSGDIELKAGKIEFDFEGRQDYSISYKKTAFDCEAIVSIGDSLAVITKNWDNQIARCYMLANKEGEHQARLFQELKAKGLVTGADYHPGTNKLVLCGYGHEGTFMYQGTLNRQGGKIRAKNLQFTSFPLLNPFQVEGICVGEGGTIYLSSEKTHEKARIFIFSNNWPRKPGDKDQ